MLSPASDQPHPGEFHVCFALGTNFGATSRCKSPHLRPAPTHRREAVERELSAGGGNEWKPQRNSYLERSRIVSGSGAHPRQNEALSGVNLRACLQSTRRNERECHLLSIFTCKSTPRSNTTVPNFANRHNLIHLQSIPTAMGVVQQQHCGPLVQLGC